MQVNELARKAFAAWSRTMCGDAGMRPIYWSEEGCIEQRAWISAVEAVIADLRIRELEAELQVRDNMGNEVLRILREATGKRDFHSEMEAAEWAAKLLADARLDSARLDFALKFINEQRLFAWFLERYRCRLQSSRGEADLDEWRKWIDEAIDAAIKEAK